MREIDRMAGYDLPLADTGAPAGGGPLQWPRRGEGRARSLIGRMRTLGGRRRLAVLDSHFPWKRSGFRYQEAIEIHRTLPNAAFFSQFEMTDPFPAPVYPLSHFPVLAPTMGITDVYAVFLDLLTGLLGIEEDGAPVSTYKQIDVSPVLDRQAIDLHAGIYPGGGFLPTEQRLSWIDQVAERASTVLTWVPEVLEHIDRAVHVRPAFVNGELFAPSETRWRMADGDFTMVFAADDRPRKGLRTLIKAFNRIDADIHLHIIGPHEKHLPSITNPNYTFHGWLEPQRLREIYDRAHLFVSPVWAEPPGDTSGDGGVTDGFPTATAADAVATGCALVSGNPQQIHDELRPGVDYVEIDGRDAAALGDAIVSLMTDRDRCRTIADSGRARVREMLDVRSGTGEKLGAMGLVEPRT